MPITAADFAEYAADLLLALAKAARACTMPELAERIEAAASEATRARNAARRVVH